MSGYAPVRRAFSSTKRTPVSGKWYTGFGSTSRHTVAAKTGVPERHNGLSTSSSVYLPLSKESSGKARPFRAPLSSVSANSVSGPATSPIPPSKVQYIVVPAKSMGGDAGSPVQVDDEVFIGPIGSAERRIAHSVTTRLGGKGAPTPAVRRRPAYALTLPSTPSFTVYSSPSGGLENQHNNGRDGKADAAEEAEVRPTVLSFDVSDESSTPQGTVWDDDGSTVGSVGSVGVSGLSADIQAAIESFVFPRAWFPQAAVVLAVEGIRGLAADLVDDPTAEIETRTGVVANPMGLDASEFHRPGGASALVQRARRPLRTALLLSQNYAATGAKLVARVAEGKARRGAAVVIQATVRMWLARRAYTRARARIPTLQALVRGASARAVFTATKSAVLRIQSWFRGTRVRAHLHTLHAAASSIQKWFRSLIKIVKYREQVLANMSINYAIGTAMSDARRRKQDSRMARIQSMLKSKAPPEPVSASKSVVASSKSVVASSKPVAVAVVASKPVMVTSTSSKPVAAATSSSTQRSQSILNALQEKKRKLERIRAERAKLQSSLAAARSRPSITSTTSTTPSITTPTTTSTIASTTTTASTIASTTPRSTFTSTPRSTTAPRSATTQSRIPMPSSTLPVVRKTADIQTELSELEKELLDRVSDKPARVTLSPEEQQTGSGSRSFTATGSEFDFDFCDSEEEDGEDVFAFDSHTSRANTSMPGLVEAFDAASREELERLVSRNTSINGITRVRMLQRQPKMSKTAVVAARIAKAQSARNKTTRVRWANIIAHDTSLCSTPTPKISTPQSRLKANPTTFPHKDSAPSPVYIQRFY